jgi:ribosomal-protein-alanine N-acetyltransferase
MTSADRYGTPVEIRPAGPAAAGVIARLSEGGATEPWPAPAVARVLGLPGCRGLLAVGPDGEPAGFVIVRVALEEAEILNLVVEEGDRRKGVGRRLVDAALDTARRAGASAVFLEVAAGNLAGCALYESAGFRKVGLRPDYYRTSCGDYADALIMKRATVESPAD